MPLANYITEFLDLDRMAQATAVIKGKYTPSQLESLKNHATSAVVLETIETMIGHGELDLPEAVTPQPIARQDQNETVVSFSLNLQSLAAHMNYRYEILTNPSRAQSRALIELGFMVLLAKRELDHGELTSWIKANTNVSEQWTRYARRSAEQYIDANGENSLLLLCNPSADTDKTDRVLAEQQMMDFTEGRGPSALLDALGIKKRPPNNSGYNEPLAPGETQAHRDACELVFPLMDQLQGLVIGDRRVVQHMTVKELQVFEADLVDSLLNVRNLIAAG
jgi:hypothetical protein